MMRWGSIAAVTLALGVGCGESSTDPDAGATDAGAGADASAADAAVDVDASRVDAGALDGGTPACGDGPRDTLDVADNCRRPECFDDATCTAQQLEAQGHVGFTRCGSAQPIDPSSSAAACMEEPPFGGGGAARQCGLLSYAGEVTVFCAPDGSSAVARFSATLSPPSPGIYYHLGHEYWAGSGGGSGDSYNVSSLTDDFGQRFVGYQSVELPETGSVRLNVWFMSGDLMSAMYIAGGFEMDLPPS